MRLLVSPTSPYARKARIVARENGLISCIEEEFVNAHQDPANLIERNPLGKIPVLIREDGDALYDSPVICEYLDSLGAGQHLLPESGAARWTALRMQALADGIVDLVVATFLERSRLQDERSPSAIERWRAKIERATAALSEMVSDDTGNELDLGRIACAVALGYLDLRLPDFDWRAAQPRLDDWYTRIGARQSLQETAPPAA